MANNDGYWQSLARIALLFAMAALCVKPSAAQQDLQIMVNGPWSYVANDDKTIFLVAPGSMHHKTYIFAGTDAAEFAKPAHQGDVIPAGGLTLTFTHDGTPITYPSDGEGAAVYPAQANPSRVSAVLTGKALTNPSAPQPSVILLPKPDSYSTFVDPNGHYDGFSESKVYISDQAVMANRHAQTIPPHLYTTWMVLHYGVKNFPVDITNASNGTKYTATDAMPGISIIAGDPAMRHDNTCDYVSLESFNDQTALWDLNAGITSKRYARFPMETMLPPGQQIHYHYDYADCSDETPIIPLRGSEKSPIVWVAAGGSADCHTHQLSINGAGPQ